MKYWMSVAAIRHLALRPLGCTFYRSTILKNKQSVAEP
jgi:hypothetical protein